MESDKNSGGRPAKFNSSEEIEKLVDEYFTWIKGEKKEIDIEVPVKQKAGSAYYVGATEKVKQEIWVREPEPPTITGLALFLGFESRQSFYDYQEREEFSYTIKKARLRIENEYEKCLFRQSPTGAIFALKNMGWADKQEVEHKGNALGFVLNVKPDAATGTE